MSDPISALSFEEAVTRLETIVSAMETGSLSLDESLAEFEQAVALSRYCAGKLEAAESRISLLTTAEGLVPASEAGWSE
jgi:exodeoxyribonuclease VII small subunit